MALAQFVQEPLNIRITKRMFAPTKKVQDPLQWYKDARKLIKELPELKEAPPPGLESTFSFGEDRYGGGSKDYWYLQHPPELSVRYLKFTIVNLVGERAHLVIDRTQSPLGT